MGTPVHGSRPLVGGDHVLLDAVEAVLGAEEGRAAAPPRWPRGRRWIGTPAEVIEAPWARTP